MTDTGVKDKYFDHFFAKIQAKCASVKNADTRTSRDDTRFWELVESDIKENVSLWGPDRYSDGWVRYAWSRLGMPCYLD